MPIFTYQAKDADGHIKQGMIDAGNEQLAVSLLVDHNLKVVTIKRKRGLNFNLNFLNRIKAKEVVIFSRQFSVMISASIPVVQALKVLIDQTVSPALKAVVSEIADEVNGGSKLSDALAARPKIFSGFYVNVVRAGETSGKLDEVLNYLADEMEKDYDMMHKIRGAMIYPGIIITAVGIVLSGQGVELLFGSGLDDQAIALTAETLAFMGSPELVTAMALAADLRFNPLTDSVDTPDGRRVKLSPPEAPELPSNGFARGMAGCLPPLPQAERRTISVLVPPGSERLHVLEPFRPWNGRDFERLPVLIKVRGQCTTDHISPAGKWLRFRGHLDRISDNMFTAAENVFTKHTGMAIDQLDGNEKPIPEAARHYKAEGLGWVAVGDENYGEGSSREHAAMSPRHLKCKAVIAKSFARLHETNLKKQGILPLTLTAPSDYDAIDANVRVSLTGLKALAPGEPVTAILHRADGSTMTIQLNHSLTDEQIRWFRAGSALNLIRTQQRRE